MKATFAILALALVLVCCGKSDDPAVEKEKTLPINERVRASVDWSNFKNSSDDDIDEAQKDIDLLRAKIYLATAKDKVKIRRIINKNEYSLERLRKELYDHDAWFEKHIGTYNGENASKIEAFMAYFRSKIDRVKTEIDNCNC